MTCHACAHPAELRPGTYGALCILVEAWGSRVYVTCPKLSGRPAGDA